MWSGCRMWKPEHRAAADRRGLRYPSDLTDAEWALVAPLIRPAKRGGPAARPGISSSSSPSRIVVLLWSTRWPGWYRRSLGVKLPEIAVGFCGLLQQPLRR